MSCHAGNTEASRAAVVSSEFRNILEELDSSDFVHAQKRLSRRLDMIGSELERLEAGARLGSEPRSRIDRMLGGIVDEKLDSRLRSIHTALLEACSAILDNSREIRKMSNHLSDLCSGPCGTGRDDGRAPVADGGRILSALSDREREVVEHLLSGLSNREIADRLGICERTVKNHLYKIYKKIGIENRSQLFSMLIRP